MTQEQINFLATMTDDQARRLCAKFKNDPEVAHNAGDAAYVAFNRAFEQINPGEYWQRRNMASGVTYHLIAA